MFFVSFFQIIITNSGLAYSVQLINFVELISLNLILCQVHLTRSRQYTAAEVTKRFLDCETSSGFS